MDAETKNAYKEMTLDSLLRSYNELQKEIANKSKHPKPLEWRGNLDYGFYRADTACGLAKVKHDERGCLLDIGNRALSQHFDTIEEAKEKAWELHLEALESFYY